MTVGTSLPGYQTLQENVATTPAVNTSMPPATTSSLQLVAAFNWKSETLELLMKLHLTGDFAPGSANHTGFHLTDLLLLFKLSKTSPQFGFGMEMDLVTDDQTFQFQGLVIVTAAGEVRGSRCIDNCAR